MTDRDIMLRSEETVTQAIEELSSGKDINKKELIQLLESAREDIHRVATSIVDYQIVVDQLDDNILIADREERVLYINRAYEENTGIPAEALLGKTVTELLESGKYFTQAVVPDVIRQKKRVMKLSDRPGEERPGIVIGTPVFDADNKLQYVVASNRGLNSFFELRDNFNTFMDSLRHLHKGSEPVRRYQSSQDLPMKHRMVGGSEEMQKIIHFVENVGATDAAVLITGESGTGKELIADAIYKNSGRAKKPFIKVNCTSIPATLIESELFGYEKGAFSGASSQGKKGLFEAANGGTLLLDEIGDMPLELQAKLLRVLQSNEVTRVGGTKPIQLDIRLITSTNSNLKEKIKEGTFRSDLYYRLHIIPIHIPPLRERVEDIPALCDYYTRRFSEKYSRSISLSEENIELLQRYPWPGNIRELRNIMEYLVVCCADMLSIDNELLRGVLDFADEEKTPDAP